MATEQSDAEPTWDELLGAENWSNLLDPLNLYLRRLILLCGDLCQVTYDTFISDNNSRYCGSSRYGKKSIFRNVFFPYADEFGDGAAAFLYATAQVDFPASVLFHHTRSPLGSAWDSESNFMGYVAVTTAPDSPRVIYVAWRGTIRNYEWVDVLQANMESAKPLLSTANGDDNLDDAKVMDGWLTIYTSSNPDSRFANTSARVQLLTAVKKLTERYKGEKLSVVTVGHSLGASLAILSAFDLVENGVLPEGTPVAAFVFGCPQLGNKEFKDRVEKHKNLKILHTRNEIDLIPLYPGTLLGYVDMGTELVINTKKSPELSTGSPADWHNLQGMLHVVAGWNGKDGEFEMRVKRSLALVNKSSGFLKDKHLVPDSWWAEKNKGMVLDQRSGEWILAPPDDEDLPVPDS